MSLHCKLGAVQYMNVTYLNWLPCVLHGVKRTDDHAICESVHYRLVSAD